ncbi:MAG: patatin-like phospholipase family protein [Planctomycetes bacterium]|nr:patatin-like phospholipase family protein [Planctomycetota bacterium]
MSGGGARAAYQVGFLRALARQFPELQVPIVTGVSAGAINAALLASREGSFGSRVETLAELWSELHPEAVYRVGMFSLLRNMARTGMRLLSGGAVKTHRLYSLVDTAPVKALLERVLGAQGDEIPGIARNIASGALHAVAVTASNYGTGQSITFVQGRDIQMWERAHRRSVSCKLRVEHVMASAALPMLFPAVEVGHQWFGDGGIRLTAPLSPAVHLGARRIIAISTRYGRSQAEADQPATDGYPPIAQIAGVLFNAIFLDQFDADALSLQRVNRVVERLPEAARGDLAQVELLLLRPSRDLGRLANEYEAELPRAFRFMTRGLGTRETRSNDMLSLVMFQPDYLARLIELGETDAQTRMKEIESFLAAPAVR